ncbi:uncharacterized protein Dvar_35500 [Desulfosarcina variabilis str. Montpellier]
MPPFDTENMTITDARHLPIVKAREMAEIGRDRVGPSRMPNWCGFRLKIGSFFCLKLMFLEPKRAF